MNIIKTRIYLISFLCALSWSADIVVKPSTQDRFSKFKRNRRSLSSLVDVASTTVAGTEHESHEGQTAQTSQASIVSTPSPTPLASGSTPPSTPAPAAALTPSSSSTPAASAVATSTTTPLTPSLPPSTPAVTTATPAPIPASSTSSAPVQPVATSIATPGPSPVSTPAQPPVATPSTSSAPAQQNTPTTPPAATPNTPQAVPAIPAAVQQPTLVTQPVAPPSAQPALGGFLHPTADSGLSSLRTVSPGTSVQPTVSATLHAEEPQTNLTQESNTSIAAPPVSEIQTPDFDNEDDDYDDLSDTPQEIEQDQPKQEIKEEIINEGPGFAVTEKEVTRAPDTLDQDVIQFQFEDADLQQVAKQVADFYNITFITDDIISPANGKGIKGSKISFRTEKPLSKKEAWGLFQTFLDTAGFALVPQAEPATFRIVKTEAARKSAIPAFIGVKSETLPDTDQLIRYLYFVQNISVKMLDPLIAELRSSASAFVALQEINGFILTDKSYNIKSLMNIINELDQVAMPQEVSVLKLTRANAQDVKALYDSIAKTDDKNINARLFPTKRPSSALYFAEDIKMIAEPRTNTLILLGSHEAIKKVETFITTHIDVEMGKPHSPLRVYELKYADAQTIASVMTDLTQFGKDTPAGKAGGVRDGDKYMRPMSFTPELATNRLIIRGDEEDYLKAKEVIKLLDEPQPQVAIEVLVIAITIGDQKALGTQLRSAQPGINGLVGDNVKFQTSGNFMSSVTGSSIVPNNNGTGVNRLLGNLITLATGAFAGNTLVTLGGDKFGIWGIFNVLQTVTDAEIVSNPFIVATNKQDAFVAIGETRRVVSGTVVSATGNVNSFTNDTASLSVRIKPQINSDGMIVLGLEINIDTFTDPVNLTSATKNTKTIKTTTIVADREVLALGGLVKNNINTSTNKVPLLGNIPIIGWLFKNRLKTQTKDNLLVLISSRIIKPDSSQHMTDFTKHRVQDYVVDKNVINKPYEQLDPVQRFFFNEQKNSTETSIDNLLFDRSKEVLNESKQNEKQTRATRRANRKKRKAEEQSKSLQEVPLNEPVVPGMLESIENIQVAQRADTSQTTQKRIKSSGSSMKNLFDQYANGAIG